MNKDKANYHIKPPKFMYAHHSKCELKRGNRKGAKDDSDDHSKKCNCLFKVEVADEPLSQTNVVPSLTNTENQDFQSDIQELLNCISGELKGDLEPGQNSYLEHELCRYREFIMEYSQMACSLQAMPTEAMMRSFLLLNLQNDLVKLLNDTQNAPVSSYKATQQCKSNLMEDSENEYKNCKCNTESDDIGYEEN